MRDSMMTRWLVILVLALLLVGCEEKAMAPPAPTTPSSGSWEAGPMETGRLAVLGTILPARSVKLSFLTGGLVQAVSVQVGQEVKAGSLLAELDTTDLELDVQEAEDALALSQAHLEQARSGPRRQEVAIAEAEYQHALAQHEVLLADARTEEIAAAQADYQAALARYEQVIAGASEQQLIAARSSMEKAEIALKRAQAAYDLVAWRPDMAASPQAAALHEATVDFEAAKAQYDELMNLPPLAEVHEAEAQLAHADAQLKLAQAKPSQLEVMASASSVAAAQARLELARASPRPEDVAAAQVQVQQAHTALDRATLALSRAQLLAPFDGTISAAYLNPGEWAGPGVPVVELLDTSRWRVETRNVGELNIGRVQVGQEATVRVIAFRDQELRGRVVAISPVAVVQQGDTTYTVSIDLEHTDLNLRPGMNAEVEVDTD